MIPRKRLQVLLCLLRVIYVFGDGEPGNEGTYLNELLLDNGLEDNGSTNNPPASAYHRIERVVSAEEKEDRKSNFSEDLRTDYADEKEINDYENESYEDFDLARKNSGIAITTTEGPSIPETKIENITAISTSTSINVSWSITGPNQDLEYLIDLYKMNENVAVFNTSNLYYNIEGLQPCTEYKIEVSIFKPNATDKITGKEVNIKTGFLMPSPPTDLIVTPLITSVSLKVDWKVPITAPNCVKEYQVVVSDIGKLNNKEDSIINMTKQTNMTFDNLKGCTTYVVSVAVIDIDDGKGLYVTQTSAPTSFKAGAAPWLNESDPESIKTTKDSITLLWHVDDPNNNCTLEALICKCKHNHTEGKGVTLLDGNKTVVLDGEERLHTVLVTIPGLTSYSIYTCEAQTRVKGKTSPNDLLSDWSKPVYPVTEENITSPPQEFKVTENSEKTLTFVWEPPKIQPGKLIGYQIVFTWAPYYVVPDHCNLNYTRIFKDIDPKQTELPMEILDIYYWSKYTAEITAWTKAGPSEKGLNTWVADEILQQSMSDPVTKFQYEIIPQKNNPNGLNTTLSWYLPCVTRGIVYYFEYTVKGTRADYEDHNITDVLNVGSYKKNDRFSVTLGELRPDYNYTFEVVVYLHSVLEPGKINRLNMIYPAGLPPLLSEDYMTSIKLDPEKTRRTTTSSLTLLPVFPDINGKIKYYAVMVASVPFANISTRFDFREHKWPNASNWHESSQYNFQTPYQATEPRWKPSPDTIVNYGHMQAVRFVVGDDSTCPQVSENTKIRVFCNGPLKPDSWYFVRMRAFTDQAYTDSPAVTIKTNAELNVGLVLGVVFGILFVGTTTTLMLMIKRCSVRLLIQRILQSSIPESPVPNPLTRRKFINHCHQLADNPGKLSNEFQLLQTLSIDLQMPSNTACLQANRKKNRYSDILPYDFSRVKLDIIDNDPNSDYINASFVTGYSGNEEYIACQGPKEETTYDFWRMIDQYDVKMILMLTQLVERGKEKCHQYYPTIRETFTYEKFSIKCTGELDFRNYTHRTLVMQKDDIKRTITHLHFKEWPDYDVPDDYDAMLHFCQMFRKQLNTVKGLAVIHCSAGIGRTGTLIAVDILLQSLRDNRKIDVFGTVYRLRRHRLNMVQRESQYAYIYNCIRTVLNNPYFSKTYKPPPIEPYTKSKTQKDNSDSSTDLVESFDTLRKNSLSTSVDSMQPLCQSSPQSTPKIQMNGLRYCKSTSAIDTRSNHNRIGKCNSEHYVACETRDSFSTSSKESADETDLKSSTSSVYENVEPLIQLGSSQTVAGTSYSRLTDEAVEKDTSL